MLLRAPSALALRPRAQLLGAICAATRRFLGLRLVSGRAHRSPLHRPCAGPVDVGDASRENHAIRTLRFEENAEVGAPGTQVTPAHASIRTCRPRAARDVADRWLLALPRARRVREHVINALVASTKAQRLTRPFAAHRDVESSVLGRHAAPVYARVDWGLAPIVSPAVAICFVDRIGFAEARAERNRPHQDRSLHRRPDRDGTAEVPHDQRLDVRAGEAV